MTAYTGAGISTAAGIKDYASKAKGTIAIIDSKDIFLYIIYKY